MSWRVSISFEVFTRRNVKQKDHKIPEKFWSKGDHVEKFLSPYGRQCFHSIFQLDGWMISNVLGTSKQWTWLIWIVFSVPRNNFLTTIRAQATIELISGTYRLITVTIFIMLCFGLRSYAFFYITSSYQSLRLIYSSHLQRRNYFCSEVANTGYLRFVDVAARMYQLCSLWMTL